MIRCGYRRSVPCPSVVCQPPQGHGTMLSIQYRSTASSAAKSTSTFTKGDSHLNRSRNSISGPISFRRVKTISKNPSELAAQRDASTDTTAVHFRSSVGGFISEKWTLVKAKVGLHNWPEDCITLISPITPVRNQDIHNRYIVGSPSGLTRDDQFTGLAEGSFTLNIAADVSAAYAQNPPAIATKNPIAPRSSQ